MATKRDTFLDNLTVNETLIANRFFIRDTQSGKFIELVFDTDPSVPSVVFNLPINNPSPNDVLTSDGDITTWSPLDSTQVDHLFIQNNGTVTHATIDSFLDQNVKATASPTFENVTVVDAPTIGSDVANKDYVDSVATGIVFLEEVLGLQSDPPVGPSSGDRYVILPTGTGAWAGQDNDIAEWNGLTWDFTTPVSGNAVAVVGTGATIGFNGTEWTVIIEPTDINIISPLTTKGDIMVRDATEIVREAVGANGEILTANSAQASGVEWAVIDQSAISHLNIQDIGVLTHATIDSFLNQSVKSAASPSFGSVTVSAAPSAGSDLTNKTYVDSISTGTVYLEEVIDERDDPPGVPVTDDRYIIGDAPTGAWVGREQDIAEWNGASWDFTVPVTGNAVFQTGSGVSVQFNGADWVIISSGVSLDAIAPTTLKGDLMVESGGGIDRFGVGTDGQLLIANSAQALGVQWASLDQAQISHLNIQDIGVLTHAQIDGFIDQDVKASGSPTFINATVVAAPTAGSDLANKTYVDSISLNDLTPQTTLGDLIAYNGFGALRLGAGPDGSFLTADSGQASGLVWSTFDSASVDHLQVQNRGSVTHAQIDSFINQDVKTSGSPTFTGVTVAAAPTSGSDLTNKTYVDAVSTGTIYLEEVIDALSTPPGGPSPDDRYVVEPTGTGAWSGQDNDIAEWNGASWDFTTPDTGNAVFQTGTGVSIQFNGSVWVVISSGVSLDAITPTTTKGDLIVDSGSGTARFPVGADSYFLLADSDEPLGLKYLNPELFLGLFYGFSYVLPQGTDGGSLTGGVWNTRLLNTTDANNPSSTAVSRSGNNIIVEDGTYLVNAHATSYSVDASQLRWFNVTDAVAEGNGTTLIYNNNNQVENTVLDRFIVTGGPKTFRLEHIPSRTRSNGAGLAANIAGVDEIYVAIEITAYPTEQFT